MAAPYQLVPLAYQVKLTDHLPNLRQGDKIQHVDSRTQSPWTSNVVTTKKERQAANQNEQRHAGANKALRRTAQHVETIQEIQQLFKHTTCY